MDVQDVQARASSTITIGPCCVGTCQVQESTCPPLYSGPTQRGVSGHPFPRVLESLVHTPCLSWMDSHINPTPNPHRSIDHLPTESIKRPTRSQIAPLQTVPVFRSPCHTPHTTLASPPFPSRPGTSIPIDHYMEGLQMANICFWKERTKPSRRMSYQRPAITAD